jgi:hypothetical protein
MNIKNAVLERGSIEIPALVGRALRARRGARRSAPKAPFRGSRRFNTLQYVAYSLRTPVRRVSASIREFQSIFPIPPSAFRYETFHRFQARHSAISRDITGYFTEKFFTSISRIKPLIFRTFMNNPRRHFTYFTLHPRIPHLGSLSDNELPHLSLFSLFSLLKNIGQNCSELLRHSPIPISFLFLQLR